MNPLLANCGSTATPSRPRSELLQITVERSSAGVVSRVPPLRTRSRPGCVVMSIRPSGVKARAVGAGTLATTSSAKFAGSVTALAGDADAASAATVAVPPGPIAVACPCLPCFLEPRLCSQGMPRHGRAPSYLTPKPSPLVNRPMSLDNPT